MPKALLPIITIDGPAGVGKSTIASLMADRLNLPYLNTGSMFRIMALKLGDLANELTAEEMARKFADIEFALEGSGQKTELLCNGENLENAIRNEKISALASTMAQNPALRTQLLLAQRAIASQGPLLTEGRDMGTVVFPNARYKFFLQADPSVRAQRRYLQYLEKGQQASLQELEKLIRQRDEQDQSRLVAPLKAAEDAIIIDTSSLGLPEVLDRMLSHVDVTLLK